jgi:hypothetical protein
VLHSSFISATIEPNWLASDLAKLMERISDPLQGFLEASAVEIVVALETLIPIVASDMDKSLCSWVSPHDLSIQGQTCADSSSATSKPPVSD